MKAKDLSERSVEDLKELEKSLRKDFFQNRLKNFTNRLDDTSSIRKTRRELARVITIIGIKARAAKAGDTPVAAKPAKAVKAPKAPKAATKTAKPTAAKPKAAKKTPSAK